MIEVSPSGQGHRFAKLDADLLVPALLASKTWTAARRGAEGGKSASEIKGAAACAKGRPTMKRRLAPK